MVVPNPGVIYTGSVVKVSEHGGFSHDDTNVALLVSGAGVSAPGSVNTQYVETTQVAPTILKLLGLNPDRAEGRAGGRHQDPARLLARTHVTKE